MVIVTEHQYVPWTEEKQLFEGTAQAGDVITFDEPMHGLVAQGFTIQASGANWARVSAGSGTLTGKTYIHNTRQVSKAVQAANTPNVKTVEDATLVSLANSTAVAQRLADYYRCRERVDSAVVYQGESPGDRLATYHPFDRTGVAACCCLRLGQSRLPPKKHRSHRRHHIRPGRPGSAPVFAG